MPEKSLISLLQFQQTPFEGEAAAVADQTSVMAYYTVARDYYGNGVAVVCHAYRSDRFGPANGGGNFLVGAGLAIGDVLERPPYRTLKFGAVHDQGKGKSFPFA